MKTQDTKCSHFISREDSLSRILHLVECDKRVVASVSHRSCVDGRIIKESVCKTHLNSLKKFAVRVFKRTDYDIELKINGEYYPIDKRKHKTQTLKIDE